MRFSEDSFDIPDDLIKAHEQGQVVFFCGSGISRAADELPDFWGLAELVVNDLRASTNSDSRKFLASAQKIKNKHPELSSAATADQLFSLLELEFLTEDIERAVLKALTPSEGLELSYHKTILKLAKTHNGRTQLVTTNFDRIFEQADSSIETWVAPRFPELDKGSLFDGLVYLHGRANADYSSSDGHDVILNTADFGHAYIADGWATRFFKQVVEQYNVVFVGYSADDPPINFLLRALKKYRGKIKGLYAFESGSQHEASERWRHKGVEGIAFPNADYGCLWRTLGYWANFHNNKNEWFGVLFHKAKTGPAALKPFEREQVAYLAKSVEGVKRILAASPALPADWLCVFDQNRRYAEQSYTPMGSTDSKPTAFSLYGLATDPIAQISSEGIDPFPQVDHIKPINAWHAFRITKDDCNSDFRHHNLADGLSDGSHELPERLNLLCHWIAQNIDHPASLWWAQLQTKPVHRQLKDKIEHSLTYPNNNKINTALRQEWLKLIHVWQNTIVPHHAEWYRLEQSIEKYGWSSLTINEIGNCLRPKLKIQSYASDPIAPYIDDSYKLKIDVNYQEIVFDITIPQEFLSQLVRKIRDNLILSTELENFTFGRQRRFFNTLTPDPSSSEILNSFGINSLIQIFLDLFTKLKQSEIELARQEYYAWPINNEVFSLLKIWAARDPLLSNSSDFGALITTRIAKEQLWAGYFSRELHLSLKDRWAGLSDQDKNVFCSRLLEGCNKYEEETERDWSRRRAFYSLSSIHWMRSNNCELFSISENDIAGLKALAPEWQSEDANDLVKTSGISGGVIQTNTDYQIFDGLSEGEIIDKAYEYSGREFQFLVENKPFQGLAANQPLKALSALKIKLNNGDFTARFWREFFSYKTRDGDTAELTGSIAEILITLENEQLSEISHAVFRWFREVQNVIAHGHRTLLAALRLKLFNFLIQHNLENDHEIDDLLNYAINQPAGMFVEALINNPEIENNFIPKAHLEMLSSLIHKPDNDGKIALVLCVGRLNWFFHHNPQWTNNNLLSVLTNQGNKETIFWIGFLWTARTPSTSLFKKIKPRLLDFAKSNVLHQRGLTQNLAGVVLSGWLHSNQPSKRALIKDQELTDILLECKEDFRISLLWNLRRWIDEEKYYDWCLACYRLFHDVWPKQKTLKTPDLNNNLYSFLLSRDEHFDHYFGLIFPLIITNKVPRLGYFDIEQMEKNTSGPLQFPELTLKFLSKILQFDARDWFYEDEKLVQYFITNHSKEAKNADLEELISRLNRR
jgi:hypothetical protein